MMASPSSELSLECKSLQSYSMLLKSFTDHNPLDQVATHKLEDYLLRLEEERLKIEAFKRELPLCMQLLTHEMEASRQQLQSYRPNQGSTRPVLEEFIPIKQPNFDESNQKPANIISDKANWMTSAQLWSQAGDGQKQQPPSTLPKSEADISFGVNPKLGLDTKQRNGGAFLPFTKDKSSCSNDSSIKALPELALVSCERDIEDHNKCRDQSENEINGSGTENSPKLGNNGVVGKGTDAQTTTTTTTSTSNTTTQTHRKARRCWSPDLHRRFVNALQVLGGSQVATPKQIRELMKVDGLTNDEVKSHLQKYRLHTRRPGPSPQAAGAPTPQLVVLGGIWVPPEYATAHSGAPTIYSTHPNSQVSPHYCASGVPQDFYTLPPPPTQAHPQLHHQGLHHHHGHHQVHVYKTSSHTQTHSSPESDDRRGVGDRSESIEDGKSQSGSWKADSGGENGGERKKLAALRDDGEVSNGSEITLKF